MATKTINVPQDLQHYPESRLIKFLFRGQYDVEYREKRNKRISGERKDFDAFKKKHGANWRSALKS